MSLRTRESQFCWQTERKIENLAWKISQLDFHSFSAAAAAGNWIRKASSDWKRHNNIKKKRRKQFRYNDFSVSMSSALIRRLYMKTLFFFLLPMSAAIEKLFPSTKLFSLDDLRVCGRDFFCIGNYKNANDYTQTAVAITCVELNDIQKHAHGKFPAVPKTFFFSRRRREIQFSKKNK